MPNYCDGNIKVRGYKASVDEFIRILNADYNYSVDPPEIPNRHFFRIFETHTIDYRNIIGVIWTAEIAITCAWSVYCCMWDGPFTYYSENKDDPVVTRGTNLIIESKRLGLEIEVFSEELGMMFQEHYRLQGGVVLANEEHRLTGCYWLEAPTLNDYIKEWGENDLGISTEEEYQALKNQTDESGLLVTGRASTEWTMPDKPNYMVNLVAVKRRKDG